MKLLTGLSMNFAPSCIGGLQFSAAEQAVSESSVEEEVDEDVMEMESIARSSEYHGKEDSQNSEPNEDNDSHNANTGNPGSSNASETTQVPNDEVENNRADDDGTSSIMNQSDANTIISSQIRVEVADEATKETEAQVLIPGIEETDPMMEETAP
ncbi:uncharacterized protein LOC113321108 [Papaver somniferum]|uniref:uncharacterized protein LOC113321108 n=1 Tax=Papaver somniferum TaxID=3469 RepID=UPI000E6F83BD|nr:uncharacterized protein LOC113321108 [Papaver somniferum]XP_026424777.1 uncharacterized protein LOC113321108 [Papaver somniferum]